MEKKLTIEEIIIKYNISKKKAIEKIKKHDSNLIKKGIKTYISENIVKSIFEQKNCEQITKINGNKFADLSDKQVSTTIELIQEVIKEAIKPFLIAIENQNKMIIELYKRIDKIENQKSLPKSANQSSQTINTNYEWYYPSTIAKHLECPTKWVLDALYQNNFLYKNTFTGKYQATEDAMLENRLKYFNGMLMINRSLINVIIKSVNTWKKNQSNLF